MFFIVMMLSKYYGELNIRGHSPSKPYHFTIFKSKNRRLYGSLSYLECQEYDVKLSCEKLWSEARHTKN